MFKLSAALALSSAAASMNSVQMAEKPAEFQQLSDFNIQLTESGKAHVQFTAFDRAYNLELSPKNVLSESAKASLASEELPTTYSAKFDDNSGFAVFSVSAGDAAHVHGTVFDSVQGEHFSVHRGAVHHNKKVDLMNVAEGRVVDAEEAFAADAMVATRDAMLGSYGVNTEQRKEPMRRLLQSGPLDPWKSDCYPQFNAGRDLTMGIALDAAFLQDFGGRSGAMTKMQTMVASTNEVMEEQLHLHMTIDEVLVSADGSYSWERNCGPSIHDTLDTFTGWASSRQSSSKDVSGWHLLSGCWESGTVGVAWVGTVCQRSHNSGVSSGRGSSWTTFAHEFGHNMGMGHTFQLGQGKTGSIMDYGRSDMPETQFYPADPRSQFNTHYSETEFCNTMVKANSRHATCQQEWTQAVCGNGKVEAGEECDDSNTNCCTSDCKLAGECHADSECCELSTCSFKDSSVQCNKCSASAGFPLTYAGKTASVNCGSPASSSQTRDCNNDGSWGAVDASSCDAPATAAPPVTDAATPVRTSAPADTCPQDGNWPESDPNYRIRISCSTGYMERICQQGGQWTAVDNSNCGQSSPSNNYCDAQDGYGITSHNKLGYRRCPSGTNGYIYGRCNNGAFVDEVSVCKDATGSGMCSALDADYLDAPKGTPVVLPCNHPEIGYRYRYCTWGQWTGESNACSLAQPALTDDVKVVLIDLDFSSEGTSNIAAQSVTTDNTKDAIQAELAAAFGVTADEMKLDNLAFPADADLELTYRVVLSVDATLPTREAVMLAVQSKLMDGLKVTAGFEVDLLEGVATDVSGAEAASVGLASAMMAAAAVAMA